MWIERPLAELATITSGGTPARDVAGYWGGEIPWVTPSDITACTTNVLRETKERITAAGLAASAARMVPAKSILLTSRATVGEARMAGMPLCTNQGFKALTAGPGIDPWFLYYQVQRCRGQFERFAAGSTFLEIGKRDTERVRLGHPVGLASQKRIAAILASLDTAIEATEALIDKHQQIKAGLMHALLTRGLLPSGALRPPPSEAPYLYRQTPLGPLPKDWGIQTLEGLLAPISNNLRSGPFGSALLKHELSESGIPLLGIDNIHVERFVPVYSRFLDQRKFLTLARYAVRSGDVIITIMGTVGRCCVVPEDISTALSSKHLWTMTLDSSRVVPDLVCWQLNHAPWARAWLRRGGQGGIMDAIQSSTLKSLRLPIPPMEEQFQAVEHYRAIHLSLQAEADRLAKLRMQKQGLMQDLLTGKVPVHAA